MTLIATSTPTYGNLVKHEYGASFAYCREAVKVNMASTDTLPQGTLLGKVTATGKYKVSVETATDGSEDVAGILTGDLILLSGVDRNCLVISRGPVGISKGALLFDASFDTDAKKQVVYDALEAKGIQLLETM